MRWRHGGLSAGMVVVEAGEVGRDIRYDVGDEER